MGREGGTGCKQISYEVLDKLCKVLNCKVGDLLEYIPKEEEKKSSS
ncbi:helix-turn-helix transcriptional regulator [bacterium]|nr:helix-turn-helix transcriptional regulator [bacterium]